MKTNIGFGNNRTREALEIAKASLGGGEPAKKSQPLDGWIKMELKPP
jgi:hypothetical protein